jgi:hypothetical protein
MPGGPIIQPTSEGFPSATSVAAAAAERDNTERGVFDPAKPSSTGTGTTQHSALQKALDDLGISESDVSLSDEDQMMAELRAGGVDVDDPAVQSALTNNPEIVASWKAGGEDYTQFFLALQQEYPIQDLTTYQQAQQQYRVQDIQEGYNTDFDTTDVSRGMRGQGPPILPGADTSHFLDEAVMAISEDGTIEPRKGTDFEVQPDTGAYVYRNGVIADPAGGVFYPVGPGSEDVQGSTAWLANARENWSEAQIKAMKERLIEYGYLPKGSAKETGWGLTLENALKGFYDQKYLHGNTPVVNDGPDGYGAGGTAGSDFVNLHELRGSIQQDVTAQYQTMFGQMPTPEETDRWIQFTVRVGNKLQRMKDFTPAGAASEAEARLGVRMQESPMGQFEQAQGENTELRDGMVAAAAAARAVGTGY